MTFKKKQSDFKSIAYGKWILAGEHSILRGGSALIFPLPRFKMEFYYKNSPDPFTLRYKGVENELFQELFLSVLDRVKADLNISSSFFFQGELLIESNIPVGDGLGSSAAFCVNMARWLKYLKLIRKEELFTFAQRLENLFHGESSGIDVALALEGKALRFESFKKSYRFLKMKWRPYFYLFHSGKKSITSHCVHQVKKFIARKPKEGKKIDRQMRSSVLGAEEALSTEKSKESFLTLAQSIHLSRECFRNWGLTGGVLEEKMNKIISLGAKAVKPTGSGDGGYILSLWEKPPEKSLKGAFLPCYE